MIRPMFIIKSPQPTLSIRNIYFKNKMEEVLYIHLFVIEIIFITITMVIRYDGDYQMSAILNKIRPK